MTTNLTITLIIYNNLCQTWKKTLVVKLLGKKLGYLTMKEKLRALGKLEGGFDLVDMYHGYFMVTLDMVSHCPSMDIGFCCHRIQSG